MKRKNLAVILTVSMTAALGSAGFAEEAEPTINILAYGTTANNIQETADIYNALEERKGTVTVDIGDGSYTSLLPSLASGEGIPDVFEIQSRDVGSFYTTYGTDMFVSLDSIIKGEEGNFVEGMIQPALAEDGSYYAIPWNSGPCVLYYQPAVLEECGIDVTTLTTWDAYIEAGKTVKEKTGKYFAAFNTNGTGCDEMMMWFNQLAGSYYAEDGSVQLNTPEMHQTLELMKEMYDAGIVCDLPNAWDDRIQAMSSGSIAALPYASWYTATMEESCADQSGQWAVTLLPAFEEGGNVNSILGGGYLIISASCEEQELALDFLRYSMMTPKGNEINLKYGDFPSYMPCYSESYFEEASEYFGGQEVNKFFTEVANGPVTDYGPYFTDIQPNLMEIVGEVVAGADIDETLDAHTEAVNAIIATK